MKTLCVLLSLAMAITATAGFKIPSGVFSASEIDKATAKAKEENLPLAIIYTNKGTT